MPEQSEGVSGEGRPHLARCAVQGKCGTESPLRGAPE